MKFTMLTILSVQLSAIIYIHLIMQPSSPQTFFHFAQLKLCILK